MTAAAASEKVYGPKRSLRNVGWVCLAFYSTLAIGTPWFFLAGADEFPRPVASAILFGAWAAKCFPVALSE